MIEKAKEKLREQGKEITLSNLNAMVQELQADDAKQTRQSKLSDTTIKECKAYAAHIIKTVKENILKWDKDADILSACMAECAASRGNFISRNGEDAYDELLAEIKEQVKGK